MEIRKIEKEETENSKFYLDYECVLLNNLESIENIFKISCCTNNS